MPKARFLIRTLPLFVPIALALGCFDQQENRKILKVPEIVSEAGIELSEVSKLLEARTELISIDLINWDEFPYRPEVKFRMAHSNNQIWLKYYVKEHSVLAEVTETNGAVANDSCVEFFFDPRADGNYYNFEFSCIGTTHLAYGPQRSKRVFIDPRIIEHKLLVGSSLGNTPFKERTGDYTWEMTIIIPASTLSYDSGIRLKGLTSRANFYKCGNKTAEAHYVSWNEVGTNRPDFHRPEFFGTLIFE